MRKPLQNISTRLQNMRLKLMKYDIKLEYLPGNQMFIADTLSRAPITNSEVTEEVENVSVFSLESQLNMSESKRSEYLHATREDVCISKLKEYIQYGWPEYFRDMPDELKGFWNIKNELFIKDDFLFWGKRLIIPKLKQNEVLRLVHEGHLGIEKCRNRVKECVFWPRINEDIKNYVTKCEACMKCQRSQTKEPIIVHPLPNNVWKKLGADICEFKGRDYLVVVDYLSKFPELLLLKSKSAENVIISLKSIFSRHGIPQTLICDNVPFNSIEMRRFSKEWGFDIVTSSPHFPQSNGLSERYIQTVKQVLRKCELTGDDPYIAMMNLRDSPITGTTLTPAELLMGRRIRTKIPAYNNRISCKDFTEGVKTIQERHKEQSRWYRSSKKPLPELKTDNVVYAKNGKIWSPGHIVSKHSTPRSYIVQNQKGNNVRRNRLHLRYDPIFSKNEDDEFINKEGESKDQDKLPENPITSQSKRNELRTRSGRLIRLPARLDL